MAGKSNKTQSFEDALGALEKIVTDMEAGKLTLEESLAAYQKGMALLQQCRSRLEEAQQQVRVLENGSMKSFADGQAGGEG